jgi:rubredoxin
VGIASDRKEEVEETYECQECGETKKIYELASVMQIQTHAQA